MIGERNRLNLVLREVDVEHQLRIRKDDGMIMDGGYVRNHCRVLYNPILVDCDHILQIHGLSQSLDIMHRIQIYSVEETL